MTPTRAQFQVLRALSQSREAHVNHYYRVANCGRTTWEIRVRPEVIKEMVEAGYLTHIIHRGNQGEALNQWRITAMGLGAFIQVQQDYKDAFDAPKTPSLTDTHIEVLALLCSSPKAVILPSGNFRGTKHVPGIERDRVCPKLSLNMQALGLLERVPGGMRLPMLRATVKGIQALAEHIYHRDQRTKAVCICGQSKGEHTDTTHVFTDTLDVAVVDFIEAMLKERENVEQAA